MTVVENEDRELEDFLARRSVLHRRLADRDYHEPSPELDRLVLDRAREAIEVSANAPMYRAPRWALPVALAASVVLALAVVVNVARLHGRDGYPVAAPMSAVETGPAVTAESKAGPVPPPAGGAQLAQQGRSGFAPAPRTDSADAPRSDSADDGSPPLAAANAHDSTLSSASADAPRTASAQETNGSASQAAAKARVDSTHSPRFARAESPGERRVAPARESALRTSEAESPNPGTARLPPSQVPLPDAPAPMLGDKSVHTDPQAWMRQIEQLRLAGKSTDADREIAAFRKAFPQVPVSAAALGHDSRPTK
ncbi:MAG TPA: hypothetical protein VFS52_09430 [Steroidobacteraceae bacterium]|nr:hypothetical protein [Steroidobacteraceae bacterium]